MGVEPLTIYFEYRPFGTEMQAVLAEPESQFNIAKAIDIVTQRLVGKAVGSTAEIREGQNGRRGRLLATLEVDQSGRLGL
jgi:hypothetical protein